MNMLSRGQGKIWAFWNAKRMIIKSDQEPAIRAVRSGIKREREEYIMMEESPVGESQSDGSVGNAIKIVQGQIRTLRDGLAMI